MLRIKDQILTIRECLSKLEELVDEIVIVDNGSTDGTLNVYKECEKIVAIENTKGFNEGRDKCLAHDLAKTRNPDWILWIDADEVFENMASRESFESYISNPNLNLVKFRLFHFWRSKHKYRVDDIWKKYTSAPQRQMWRNIPSAYFKNIKFHNGGIMGVPPKHITSAIRLKHFGYIHKIQLSSKKKTYESMSVDPMAKKTLSMSTKNMKLVPFRESKIKAVNSFIQQSQHLYWGALEKYYTYLAPKISYTVK